MGKNCPILASNALSLSASIPIRSAIRVSFKPIVIKSFAMSNLPRTTLIMPQIFAGKRPVLSFSSSAAVEARDALLPESNAPR